MKTYASEILQIEYAVLACMLQDETACMEGLSTLTEADFSTEFTQEAYRVISELISDGSPVDETIIKSYVHDQTFTTNYNSFIKNVEIKHINFRAYFSSLRDHSKTRQLKEILSGKYKKLNEEEASADTIIEEIFAETISLVTGDPNNACATMDSEFSTIYDVIDGKIKKPDPNVISGFRYIDDNLKMNPSDYVLLAARPGVGKAQPLDSLVLTKNGFVKMGDIRPYDMVIGEDGKEHQVLNIFPQGVMDIYEVHMSDGTTARCTKDHLWLTKTHNEQKGKNAFSVKTTEQIIKTLKIGKNRNNHEMPIPDCIIFDKQNVDIDPYILGVLLGDGGISGSTPRIFNTESDIISKVASRLPSTAKIIEIGDGLTYRITNNREGKYNKNPITEALRKYGLYGKTSSNKFIPKEYIYNNVHTRVDILQGIFDTDGYVKQGTNRVEFTTISKKLAKDVLFIARSLGAVGHIKGKTTSYKYKNEKRIGKLAYRVCLWFSNGIIPISSNKNIKKWKSDFKFMFRKHITKVEYVGTAQCKCILIDSNSHLYITNDFIVTHNTAFMMHLIDETTKGDKDVLVFSIEMPKIQLAERYLAKASGIAYWKIRAGKGFTEKDFQLLDKSKPKIEKFKKHVLINDNSRMTIDKLSAIAKKEYIKNPNISAVFIDYVQLMQSSEDLNVETSKISRGLKQIARELNVPVIALSQLSRKLEARPIDERRPILSDLRDSGSLEQDADAVVFLYSAFIYTKADKDKGVTSMICAKQRNGILFDYDMGFDGSIQTFKETP